MARIVVVGAGFAGLSAAARLAKLRHEVVVLEATDRVGGRLHRHVVDGTEFALHPETVTLPGVLRDLFRKSGRPLERVADMTLAGPRRHVFRDGEVLDLPFGDRASQHDAVVAGLGDDEWSDWIDSWPDAWNAMRLAWLDRTTSGLADLDREARRALRVRRSIERLAKRDLKRDPAVAKIVLDPLRLEGQDRRVSPAFLAVRHYVERTFGRWGFDGGLPVLADALRVRLEERKVGVELGRAVEGLLTQGDPNRGGRVTGVVTAAGDVEADLVVWCAAAWPAPLREPGLNPAIPACRTFVRLDPDFRGLPDDVFVHANPPIRMWHAGGGRWTVLHLAGERPLEALARAGLDLRAHVVDDPVTLVPADLVRLGHWGWQWFGASSMDLFPGVAPRDDIVFAGAHAWPSGLLGGGTVEEIGMATAAIAERVGPAPR
ncbi:MAG TPA: FAD-dependent oxidoreductase [Aeromicrobium sp.]|nr:FAD-dependent oxidoreductase [Aeromicrobium sp.]